MGIGSLVGRSSFPGPPRPPYALAVADLNRDGRPDIVVGYVETPGSVYYNTGPHTFHEVRWNDGKGTVYGLAFADFNGDGWPDIVAARSDAPNAIWFSTEPIQTDSGARIELLTRYCGKDTGHVHAQTVRVCNVVHDRCPGGARKGQRLPGGISCAEAEYVVARSGTCRCCTALVRVISSTDSEPAGVGCWQVAGGEPRPGDPDFARTVILLVRYDENGALGLILDIRTDVRFPGLDLEAAKGRSDPVYLGGPVGPSAVFALFKSSAKMEKAENIFGQVYLISDKTLFEKTISTRPDPARFSRLPGICRMDARSIARVKTQLGAWFVFPADTATDSTPIRIRCGWR